MLSMPAPLKKLLPQNGWQWLVLLSVLSAAVTRFYNLSSSAMFLGDQGRDALIVSRIFTEADLVFIGPVTSVGNMYLGPLYYYFMLPFLWISYPSPVGPAYGVALVGIVFIFLLYYWGRAVVGERAAAFSTVFATFSYVMIENSRFSWNPNITPLFSLLLVYACVKAIKGQEWYWVWAAVAASALLQLHYVTLLACAAAGLLWLFDIYKHFRTRELKKLLLPTVIAVGVVFFSFLPLILFDIKHDGLNKNALVGLLFSDKNFASSNSGLFVENGYFSRIKLQAEQILFNIYTGNEKHGSQLLLLAAIILTTGFLIFKKKHPRYWSVCILLGFVSISVVGLSFYQRTVYDHYILYTVSFGALLLGFLSSELWQKSWGKGVVLALLATIILINVNQFDFRQHGTNYSTLKETAAQIHERVEPGETYSIVLLSPSHDLYGMNFRYFLSTNQNKKPVSPEYSSQAEKLFIIDEEKSADRPQDLSIYEIVTYPSKEITETFSVAGGPDVFVLEKPTSERSE